MHDQCNDENYFEYCLSCSDYSILYSEFFQTEQAWACHPEPQLTCVCISQTKLKKNILITLCNAKYVKCHPEPQLTCVCISQTKLKKNILITLCNAKYVKCKPRIPMNGLQPFFSMRIGWISMRIWRWVIQSLLFRFYILGTPKTLLICHKTQK